jgi:hypothetical protein
MGIKLGGRLVVGTSDQIENNEVQNLDGIALDLLQNLVFRIEIIYLVLSIISLLWLKFQCFLEQL